MGIYAIERLVALADVAEFGSELESVRAVASVMTAHGQPLYVLHATYVPNHQRCLCVVEADDADTVLEALRRIGSHTSSVLPALNL